MGDDLKLKITVEIKKVKDFELDGELYYHIKDLKGKEALDKLIEVLEGYYPEECTDSDRLEILDNHCNRASWINEIVKISHQQTYRVYDFNKHRTLFKGDLHSCNTYMSDGNFTDMNVEIIEN